MATIVSPEHGASLMEGTRPTPTRPPTDRDGDDGDDLVTADSGKRGGDEDPGCGCQAGGPAASLAGIGLLLIAVSRRRAA